MINLNELTSHHPAFHNIVASRLPHYFAGGPQTSNHSGNNFRHARKLQTFREMICGRLARDINKKSTLKK